MVVSMPRGRSRGRRQQDRSRSASKDKKLSGNSSDEEYHSENTNQYDLPDFRNRRPPRTSSSSVYSTEESFSCYSQESSPSSPKGTRPHTFGSDSDVTDSSSVRVESIYPSIDEILNSSPTPSPEVEKSSKAVKSRPALERPKYGHVPPKNRDLQTEIKRNFPHQPLVKSETTEYKKKGPETEKTNFPVTCELILFLFVVIIAFAGVYLWLNPTDGTETNTQPPIMPHSLFIKEIEKLQPHFPNQSMRLWKSVIASSRHVLKEPNSTYPSVILMASQAQVPRLSFCIADKVASSFLQSQNIHSRVPSTDVEMLKNVDAAEQKLTLDREIQSAFHSQQGKAYVIRNLQSLSAQAALLLHGLCDGDNAPFKDVMILLTLEIKDSNPAMNAEEIEDYLAKLWTTPQVEYDKVSALMARISNNLVILNNEDSNVVDQVCPDL